MFNRVARGPINDTVRRERNACHMTGAQLRGARVERGGEMEGPGCTPCLSVPRIGRVPARAAIGPVQSVDPLQFLVRQAQFHRRQVLHDP